MWQTMCENTVALSVQKWSTTVLITLLHMWHIVGMPGHFTLDTLTTCLNELTLSQGEMNSLSHNLSQCTHSLTTCLNELTLSQGEMNSLSHNLSQCTHSLTTCLNALTLSQLVSMHSLSHNLSQCTHSLTGRDERLQENWCH